MRKNRTSAWRMVLPLLGALATSGAAGATEPGSLGTLGAPGPARASLGSTLAPLTAGVLRDTAVEVVRLNIRNFPVAVVSVTFDGTFYWAVNGGSDSGIVLQQYAVDGTLLDSFESGIDYRSILFDASDGSLLASTFEPSSPLPNRGFLHQLTDGTFGKLYNAPFQGPQSKPAISPDGAFLYDLIQLGSTVREYTTADGLPTGREITLDLQEPGVENFFPSLGFTGGLFLTLGSERIYAYDLDGNLVGSTSVPGLGDEFIETVSFALANGLAFIRDSGRARYFGFDIGLSIEIAIDVKPGSDANVVNPSSRGVIPVAILGSDELDVADVDVTTLALGPAGAPPAHKKGGHAKDANHDGVLDLLSHYRTPDSGIAAGDTQVCLTGETLDGRAFQGCDDIRTVPSRRN